MKFFFGIVMAIAGQAASASSVPIITMECEQRTTHQTAASFGNQRFSQDVEVRSQRYVIDKNKRSVTTLFGCGDKECSTWIKKSLTFNSVIVRPSGYVIYCPRSDNLTCNDMHAKSTSGGGTVTQGIGQVIISFKDGTVYNWTDLMVQGSDRSLIIIRGSTEGTCRLV